MSENEKLIFSVEIQSFKPFNGIIKNTQSGESQAFSKSGLIIDFITKCCKSVAKSECGYIPQKGEEMTQECCCGNVSEETGEITQADSEEKLELVKDVEMPKRKDIKKELSKVSNFTEEEMSIMGWSSLYKAYSLIIRYGKKGVEDEFRKYPWFEKEMKIIMKQKSRDEKKNKRKSDDSKDDKKSLKEEKKRERVEKRKARKKEKEDKRAAKKEKRERKKD